MRPTLAAIAAVVAYSEAPRAAREVIAREFAAQFRLKGVRRVRFLDACLTETERAQPERNA